jgi:hypothetical protein
MARRTFSCPHCGLVLTIEDVQGSTHISYDPGEWRRLCKHLDLDSPFLCLLQGGGGSGGSGSSQDPNGRPAH